MPPNAPTAAANPLRGRSLPTAPTVLVVEDQTLVRRAIERTLTRHHGLEVLAVGTASAALMALPSNVRGAVIDCRLPDASGVDLAREIRVAAPGARLLLITGALTAEIEREAAAVGLPITHKLTLNASLAVFAKHLAESVSSNILPLGPEHELIRIAIDLMAASVDLPFSARRILALRATGIERDALPTALGVEPTTVRKQISVLCQRTGAGSLDAAIVLLLQIAADVFHRKQLP